MSSEISKSVELLSNADSVLITSGAGMSSDSGLPTYRGHGAMSFGLNDPQFANLISESDMGPWEKKGYIGSDANVYRDAMSPQAFKENPEVAWGLSGSKILAYRNAVPHEGYEHLYEVIKLLKLNYFSFTTNVDGHFLRAGFDQNRVFERHGSMQILQCLHDCDDLWSTEEFVPELEGDKQPILVGDAPLCPTCQQTARPNVYMFSDSGWNKARYKAQRDNYHKWRETTGSLVVIELGAGTALSTARAEGKDADCPLIRVNMDSKTFERQPRKDCLEYQMSCVEFLTELRKSVDANSNN